MQVPTVVLKPLEAIRVAEVRGTASTREQMGKALEMIFGEGAMYIAQHKVVSEAPPIALYYHDLLYYDERFDPQNIQLGACWPIHAPLSGNERVHVYDLPAFQNALSLVHQGSFRSLDQTYRTLIDWIARENYRVCGPYREVFLRHEPGGNESRFLTEIQVPIEKIPEQG